MQVVSVDEGTALVNFSGFELDVDICLLENVSAGDYVIVHAGFAIQVLSQIEAKETLSLIKQLEESWKP
jgi:hydrogenase expression/formation protein HypC